jgi:hypothetical protein
VRPQWVESAAADPTLAFLAREWDKSAAVPGAWFDAALADRIVELWPKYFRHTEGRWYNKPFVLSRWQEAIVRLLVGWKTEDGFRLYRRLLLWVGKKSGKSEFLAALALLFWAFDKEYGGQGFCFARNENQANIVFKKMKTMIGMSNELAADVQVFKKSLYCAALGQSLFKLLAGTTEGQHGISASVVVGDEMHEWRDDGLATTLHQSTSARSQPIELFGSTAGIKGKGYGWDLWEETQSLIEGRLADPTTLAVIFAVAGRRRLDRREAVAARLPEHRHLAHLGIPARRVRQGQGQSAAGSKLPPLLSQPVGLGALALDPGPALGRLRVRQGGLAHAAGFAQGSQLLGHARPLQDPRHHGAVPAVRAGRTTRRCGARSTVSSCRLTPSPNGSFAIA